MQTTITTFHTYPILTASQSRPARCTWQTSSPAVAVAATVAMDPESIIVGVRVQDGLSPFVRGFLPGGIGI